MSLREYLLAVVDCQSLEELWDGHVSKMAEYGFDRLLYGYTRYRTATSLGDPDDFVVLTNHDRSYTDFFLGGGCCMRQWFNGRSRTMAPKAGV